MVASPSASGSQLGEALRPGERTKSNSNFFSFFPPAPACVAAKHMSTNAESAVVPIRRREYKRLFFIGLPPNCLGLDEVSQDDSGKPRDFVLEEGDNLTDMI